jgi:dTDP-4-dehydrorhamnose reductase
MTRPDHRPGPVQLAEASWQLAKLGPEKWSGPELVHVAGTQAMSWHRFAELALKQAVSAGLIDQAVPVAAISSDEWPQKARRPNWSVLDCSQLQ